MVWAALATEALRAGSANSKLVGHDGLPLFLFHPNLTC